MHEAALEPFLELQQQSHCALSRLLQSRTPALLARIWNRCHVDRLAAQQHPRLTPVDLGLDAGVADQRHEHLAQLTALGTHTPAHLLLRHLRAVLLHQPLPNPPGGMPLLARRLPGGPRLGCRLSRLSLTRGGHVTAAAGGSAEPPSLRRLPMRSDASPAQRHACQRREDWGNGEDPVGASADLRDAESGV